jgi:chromosome segregation ATPase
MKQLGDRPRLTIRWIKLFLNTDSLQSDPASQATPMRRITSGKGKAIEEDPLDDIEDSESEGDARGTVVSKDQRTIHGLQRQVSELRASLKMAQLAPAPDEDTVERLEEDLRQARLEIEELKGDNLRDSLAAAEDAYALLSCELEEKKEELDGRRDEWKKKNLAWKKIEADWNTERRKLTAKLSKEGDTGAQLLRDLKISTKERFAKVDEWVIQHFFAGARANYFPFN